MTAPQEKAIREALPVQWTERQTMAAINATGMHGAVTLTYEHGPYDISRPSFKCDRLAEHIVALRDAQWLAQLAELRAEVERLKALVPAPPKQPEPMFWFMRDNHTFRRLSGTPEEMVAQCLEEFDSGWTFGSLFAKGLADKHFGVHASGSANREDFRTNALAALAAIENGGANV